MVGSEPVPVGLVPVEWGSRIWAAFTTRVGGASAGSWAGLDLGQHVGDDPEQVAANRGLLAQVVGAPVVFARQVHGTRVATIGPEGPPSGFDPFRSDLGAQDGGFDVLVAVGTSAVAIGVLVADCVPVLLADADAAVTAVAHAGRGGLLAGVLASAVQAMVEHGASPGRIRAVLGPSAGGCCYEVPEAMREQAVATLPAVRATTRWGTPALDLRAGCRAALALAGVDTVTDLGTCTIEDERFYSYRRAPVTGRFAGVVRMTP